MKNKIKDIDDYLFEQLDVVSNPDLKGEELHEEFERTKAITSITGQIIKKNELMLEIAKTQMEYGIAPGEASKNLIGMTSENENSSRG